ncbi:MAG: single-stranded-DNA-specific exonuclease RecJ [Clostridia bacterium]|nr:single-stranded-DNA-specific exonuclease RecJ [Clostridia bacterium]
MVKLIKYILFLDLDGEKCMALKKWCVAEYDKELAKELAATCETDPIVALIASARGYTDPMDLEQFLTDEPYFTDPWEMADISKAAELLNNSVTAGEKIAIYGDYDCDGVAATSLLYSYLKKREADVVYYIPDRFAEGYGMNSAAIEKIAQMGVKLVITVDNGITGISETALAVKLGMKVIITDHHLPGESIPAADAVVDPHRKDCPSEYKTVCGTQVAFRLICVAENKEPEELLPYYADLLSLAVITDIMPLTLENRSIVKCGIEKLKSAPLTGISALMSVSGISQDSVTAGRVAFTICPRINAAGRMGKADRAVELLTCDNMLTALGIANEIDEENSLRQQIEKKIFEEAVALIEKNNYMYDRVIVVDGEGWHHGVVGIVAARICERYGAPAILLSSEQGVATGSGRSIEGFSLYNAISCAKDILIKFGGHEQAAGITLKAEDVDQFRTRINAYADETEYIPPTLSLDCRLNPSALTLDLAFALQQLEPFGTGNAVPLFGIYGVTLQRITPIGNNKHLRLLFSKGELSFQALIFGVNTESLCFEVGDVLDLAVNIESNYFKGEYSVSIQIRAVRINGIDDDKVFEDLSLFNAFCAGKELDTTPIFPSREEVGSIYRFVCEKKVLSDRIKYIFMNKIGYGKTCAAIKTLEELKLIEKDAKGFYSAVNGAPKTSLTASPTYKLLSERSSFNE